VRVRARACLTALSPPPPPPSHHLLAHPATIPSSPPPLPHSYFGTGGGWCGGGGAQPTVLADLENGLYGCDIPQHAPKNASLPYPFVTAMVKGGVASFALKGGDATSGQLSAFYDGPRPSGYTPMHKTGAIILGVGGDNVARSSPPYTAGGGGGVPGLSIGTFYEGFMTSGYTSEATDAALAADIAAAGYGQ
jgi:hypothetical protein